MCGALSENNHISELFCLIEFRFSDYKGAMYDDPMVPLDEATDPERAFNSRAAQEWFDDETEDELYGFHIAENP